MSEYIIMTDSCCDLSDEMAKELELNVVPLTVHLEGKDYPNYLDGSAISNAEFYGAIRAGKVASTSAANVGQFQDAMRARARHGQGHRLRVLFVRALDDVPVGNHRGGRPARGLSRAGDLRRPTRSRPRWDRGFCSTSRCSRSARA